MRKVCTWGVRLQLCKMVGAMLKDILNKKVVVLDGAIGTLLQSMGLKAGEKPEDWNITHPTVIEDIHYNYLMSGADIVYANTFGANPIKIKGADYKTLIVEGVKIARKAVNKAKKGLVALDIGSLGEIFEPIGTLTFDRAYGIFSEMINLVKNDVDLVVFETMSDLYELKAGILAVKENSNLPVFSTMSFYENGRTFCGTPIESMVTLAESLGVDALGLNCSLAPTELQPLVDRLLAVSSTPIILKPNAGIPVFQNGVTTFNSTAEEFSTIMAKYVEQGIAIVGGCCGTDYSYIKLLRQKIQKNAVAIYQKNISRLCSGTKYLHLNKPIIVGERINPTGKKLMKQAILDNDFSYIESQAVEQVEAGASVLDINMGVPNIDEPLMMEQAVKCVQSIVDAPLQIDSSDPVAIEKGLRYANGKAIVNSVNGDKENLQKILPLVKKYGAMVIGLTIDENGVPKTFEGRVDIAKRIIDACLEYGIKKQDIIIDCLTLTVGAEQEQAILTLQAVKYIKEHFGVKTTLGVSNISFGLPDRVLINRTFMTLALGCGLDMVIINPNIEEMKHSFLAFNLLNGYDNKGQEYIKILSNINQKQNSVTTEKTLFDCITLSLEAEGIAKVKDLLQTENGLKIIETIVIPALNKVGEGYEKGSIFLPQLISSAEVAKKVCDVIKASLVSGDVDKKFTVLLATVEGDVHDIGKNIVKTVLQNYGYNIIDLGKDVKVEEVVKMVKQHKPKVLGLSALMTTTVKNMARTIEQVKNVDKNIIVCVGGAVLNEEVAKEINADYYTNSPQQLAKLLENL